MVMDVAHTDASPFEWIAFNVAACMALSLDLLVSDGARDSAVALRWTCCWVALAMLFAAQLAYLYGRDVSMNFLTGYVVEESLSLDNLFVILLTFESFRIEKIDQHKVLLYGILSAIVLRGGCIFAGLALIERFAWMLQAFGLLLLFAVFRILTEEDEDEDEDEGLGLVDEEGGVSSSSAGMKSNGLMLRLIRLVFRVSEDEAGKGKFFIRDESGRLCATPLMVALIVVEGSDIIFAADSIPAIFGVTTDPYVVYTSNICAILGLRSLYFILAEALEQFSNIKYGLAAVLGFVAVKILIAPYLHISAGLSLGVIFAILALTAFLGRGGDEGGDSAGHGMAPGSPKPKVPKISSRAKAQYGNIAAATSFRKPMRSKSR